MVEHTLIIDLNQDLETIWRGIKKRRRETIRQAERLGVTIMEDCCLEDFQNIYWMIRYTIQVPPLDLPLRELKTCKLFVAVDTTGETVAGGAFMFCEQGTRLRLKYAASKRYDPKKKKIAGLANALLFWETIKWAKTKKMKIYDFGGYTVNRFVNNRDNTQVNAWKASFGGILSEKVC